MFQAAVNQGVLSTYLGQLKLFTDYLLSAAGNCRPIVAETINLCQ